MVEPKWTLNPECCPPDLEAVSELYLTASLPKAEAIAFENHFVSCPRCSDRLQFTQQFVIAVRRATERLRPASTAN